MNTNAFCSPMLLMQVRGSDGRRGRKRERWGGGGGVGRGRLALPEIDRVPPWWEQVGAHVCQWIEPEPGGGSGLRGWPRSVVDMKKYIYVHSRFRRGGWIGKTRFNLGFPDEGNNRCLYSCKSLQHEKKQDWSLPSYQSPRYIFSTFNVEEKHYYDFNSHNFSESLEPAIFAL